MMRRGALVRNAHLNVGGGGRRLRGVLSSNVSHAVVAAVTTAATTTTQEGRRHMHTLLPSPLPSAHTRGYGSLVTSYRFSSGGATRTNLKKDDPDTFGEGVDYRRLSVERGVSLGRGNYFAFYGLEPSTDVDVPLLQRRYHRLQVQVHPDKQQSSVTAEEEAEAPEGVTAADSSTSAARGELSEAERDALTAVSSYANNAYETLREPFTRCKYLARLRRVQQQNQQQQCSHNEGEKEEEEGGRVAAEERINTDDADGDDALKTSSSSSSSAAISEEFLAEMMSVTETVFMCDAEDPAERAELLRLQTQLEGRDAECRARASEAWAAGDDGAFRDNLSRWTYVHNALKHLKNRL